MDAETKNQLKYNYKNRPVIGAVYAIVCSKDSSRMLKSTVDIAGIKNRFQFSVQTKSCPDPALRTAWMRYGTEAFSLVVLEELKKKEEQSPKQFAEDIKVLYELWKDKLESAEIHNEDEN